MTARFALVLGLIAGLIGGCAGKQRAKGPDVKTVQAEFAVRKAKAQELSARAENAMKAGRDDEAIDLYRQAINTWNSTPSAYNNLGTLLLKKGDSRAAADAFEIEAQINPSDPRPLKNLGNLYFEKSWPEDAMKYYEEALSRDPDYLEALRGAVAAADVLRRADAKILEYVKRALFLETDPVWASYLQRQRYRIEQDVER